jgi:maleate isomerase
MEEMSGLGVSTGSDSTRMALESIGARRIGVLTPYQPALDAEVARYFDDLGYEMVAMTSLRCTTAVSIADVTGDEILEKIDQLAQGGPVDAFVQAGTNLSSYRVADEVEQRYGKPLIGINVATLVHALRAVGINDPIPGAGSVFERAMAASG